MGYGHMHMLTSASLMFYAALEDRRVSADDLKLAVKLAIAPRGIFMQNPQDDEEMVSYATHANPKFRKMLSSAFLLEWSSSPGSLVVKNLCVEVQRTTCDLVLGETSPMFSRNAVPVGEADTFPSRLRFLCTCSWNPRRHRRHRRRTSRRTTRAVT